MKYNVNINLILEVESEWFRDKEESIQDILRDEIKNIQEKIFGDSIVNESVTVEIINKSGSIEKGL